MKKDFYGFAPTARVVGQMPPCSEEIIKREPMFFSADKKFAAENGGPITKKFITDHLDDHDDYIIDSRVHMLMPGFWPCIPGWHHDDVPRSKKSFGQPDYDDMEYEARHRMCVIGKSSMTQFLDAVTAMPKVDIATGKVIYKVWDDFINEFYESKAYTVKSGQVIDFTWRDFHRGMPATESCWRFFVRASRNTNRKFFNEIRTQVQVYMSDPSVGW